MARIKSEQAWFRSTTPPSLLLALKGKRLPRRRRLLAVACCRRWLSEMIDAESRHAVEVAERYADGRAERGELDGAYRTAQQVAVNRLQPCLGKTRRASEQVWSVWRLAHAAQIACAPSGMEEVVRELLKRSVRLGDAFHQQERKALCTLIRDIFGNPFRPQPLVPGSWLSWTDRTIPKIAQTIYDDRAFDRLPILADALEEAGCQDQDILGHCRSGGQHARGCWVIDCLLAKK